jgi:hypothetical protein
MENARSERYLTETGEGRLIGNARGQLLARHAISAQARRLTLSLSATIPGHSTFSGHRAPEAPI